MERKRHQFSRSAWLLLALAVPPAVRGADQPLLLHRVAHFNPEHAQLGP